VSSSQQLPRIVLEELTWESQIFFRALNGQLDAGLAGVPRSEDPLGFRTEEPQRRELSTEEFCSALTAAAEASNIPVPFFARLIWQESRFKLDQISPAGAQGVAQFMPRTASEVGLDNPFDPLKARR
jgi:soluble lytic murein transglycosylase-like protein